MLKFLHLHFSSCNSMFKAEFLFFNKLKFRNLYAYKCIFLCLWMLNSRIFMNKIRKRYMNKLKKKLPRLSPLLIKDWIKNFFHICPPRIFGLGWPQDYGWNALVFTRNFGLFIRTILWFMIIKVQFEWGFCDFERFEKNESRIILD